MDKGRLEAFSAGAITFFIYRRISKQIDYQKIREEW